MNQPPGMFPTWKAAGRYAWWLLGLIVFDIALIVALVFAFGIVIREVF